jgi:hypothetical protein
VLHTEHERNGAGHNQRHQRHDQFHRSRSHIVRPLAGSLAPSRLYSVFLRKRYRLFAAGRRGRPVVPVNMVNGDR